MLRVCALLALAVGSQCYIAPTSYLPASRSAAATSRLNRAPLGLRARSNAAALSSRQANGFTANPTTLRISNERDLDYAVQRISMALAPGQKPVIIGLAADSGCGKSTFMRRVTACFGGEVKLNPIGRETNTLISDMTTVICLDDYHLNDRAGRKVTGRTPLVPEENNFDLMYEHVKAIKEGKTISKPIYNHVNGTLDAPETITPTPIVIFEGLHPFHDPRVDALMDFRIYVDITPEVKFNWKVQRDHEERGHSIESIVASIQARKPDFDAYIDPQKNKADCVIQVLPTELAANDKKTLRVKMIQKQGVSGYEPSALFDEGSTVEWTPAPKKLTYKEPGLKMFYGPDKWNGAPATVIGMDGRFEKIDEMLYVEKMVQKTGAKYFGEITEKMLAYEGQPGSNDGTGLLQTICACKVREIYEHIAKVKVPVSK